ncbi:MAG: stalk domain-containing protein [Lawsonibacter sp.]|jgi:hypothetical protein
MKKTISKLLCLILSLALTLSLSMPAFALEDIDPPLWEQMGYSSREELLAEGWLTEEEYVQMVQDELDYLDYLKEEEARRQTWMENHPQAVADFDPYAFYDAFFGNQFESAQDYMETWGQTEEDFRQEMLTYWSDEMNFEEGYRQQLLAELSNLQSWLDAHPDDVTAFDPYTYYQNSYLYMFSSMYSAPEYMALCGLTEEEFYQVMLSEWAQNQISLEAVQISTAGEKVALGGFPDGVNVMINGACVFFPDVRPTVENGRTMVPLATTMEYLGAQVDYIGYEKAVRLSLEEQALYIYHKVGTQELTLYYGNPEEGTWDNESGETISMDVPSSIRDGRTMVPLAFFAQALGYEVYWDDYYQTAVLLNCDALVEMIDQELTLLNRVLYTVTGSEFSQNGKAVQCEAELKMEVTEEGKTYPLQFQGNALFSAQAINLQLAADLSSLSELLMEEESGAGGGAFMTSLLTSVLSDLKLELIYNQENNDLYLRSAVLSLLGLAENPESWIALPTYEELSPIFPLGKMTVGQLLTRDDTFYGFPFHRWSQITSAASDLIQTLGDDCFTKSGSSYTIRWDIDDLDLFNPTGSETFHTLLKITPTGDKNCTFSLALSADDGDTSLELDCSGSKEKLTLEVFGKNLGTEAFHLEFAQKMSSASQSPLTSPPESDSIEYPMGELDMDNL